ncbi:MAG: hypothetical protein OXU20_20060 [Myxococcales bacterium]|nr:hypothetical protein [Myxococcales bacterium]
MEMGASRVAPRGRAATAGVALSFALGLLPGVTAAGDHEAAPVRPASAATAGAPQPQPDPYLSHPAQDRPPTTQTLEARRDGLIAAFVEDLHLHGLGNPADRLVSQPFRRMAAGLFALQVGHASAVRLRDLPTRAARFLAAIQPRAAAGTDGSAGRIHGDYDFVMKELVSLLYRFRDAPNLLSDDAAFHLLDRGLGSYIGKRVDGELTFRIGVPLLGRIIKYPETENHVLMTFSSAYLANRFVVANPRRDPRLRLGRYREVSRFRSAAAAAERVLLEACARILRHGFWEANARPYQAMSVHALMNLHAFADSPRLRTAAHNALDYLATKFAFQSIDMRRMAPYRRNARYAARMAPYESDGVPFMFGTLVGKAPWPADFPGIGNAAGHALWASLLAYRVPRAVRPHMLGLRGRYWARMMTRFAPDDYRIGRPPRYRNAGAGKLEYVPELYFKTPTFLNSAGGRYNRYPIPGDTIVAPSSARDSDFLARPTMLLRRGHLDRFETLSQLDERVMNMPGASSPWLSDNLGVYKGFAYGYRAEAEHLAWPMQLPAAYRAHLHGHRGTTTFGHPGSRAAFAFVDLSDVPDAGFYVVLGRVSKSARGRVFRRFARGFWEIVPRHRFPDVDSLRRAVLSANPASHFRDSHRRGELHYLYRMTTGETLELDARLGAGRAACDNPIRAIWPRGARPRSDPPLPLSQLLVDRCDRHAIKRSPLLNVVEVDHDDRFTGTTIAFAPGDGQLSVIDPESGAKLYLDHRDPLTPTRVEQSPDPSE